MSGSAVFDWLLDDFWVIVFLLCVGFAAFAAAWWRTRRKYYAIGAAVFLLLLAIYLLLPRFIETSSKQMERRVNDMAASVARKDISATLEKHLTDDFHAGSRDKRGFIELAEQLARAHGVDKVTVWDFNLVEIDREKGTARFHFMAKPICADRETPWYLIKAQFVRTSKGNWSEDWKMKSFEYFNPVADSNSPLPIP
jgi:hypothetical protein